MTNLMIARMFRGLSEEAWEQCQFYRRRYENAYNEASQSELDRLISFSDAYNEHSRVWALWANIWLNGYPASSFERSMAE